MYQEISLPHDVDAEEATLGSLLIDPQAIFKIQHFLRSDDFYDESNQHIFKACSALVERDEALDQITVARELLYQGKLDSAGGHAYLSHLVSVTPTSVNVEHYAHIVSRLGTMRRLIDAAGKIAAIGYKAEPDVDGAIAEAERVLYRVHDGRALHDFTSIGHLLGQYFDDVVSGKERNTGLQIRTGFPAMDNILGTLQRSDMIILGARPSLGKSSLALSIARNAALEQKACVAIFSLEMPCNQLAQRLLASESNVSYDKITKGELSEPETKRVVDAIGKLADISIYIDDSPGLYIDVLCSKARRLAREIQVDLIIVDYLTLLRGNERRIVTPQQEMTEISYSLKALARELNVPLMALSQLSRAVTQRNKPRIPQLSDLRESGSIEQDADVVLLMYRTDKDYTEEEWTATHPGERFPIGITDIEIAKHRNGPTGNIKLYFRDNLTKFNTIELERSKP